PDDAVVKDVFGNKSQLTRLAFEGVLKDGGIEPGRAFTVLASRFLDGVPKGGFEPEGVRADDANDTIPHQDRRELRGSRILFAWLQHTDIKPQNSIDMYTEDPSKPDTHYLMHYWVDFGLSLGTFGHGRNWQWDGYAHTFDFGLMGKSLITFGLWNAPWENTVTPDVPGVGHFSSEHFHVDDFRAIYPFLPHERADRLDSFWATKILMRFTPEHIRTAVEQGGYEHQESVDYLVKTLVERQRSIGRVWLTRVTSFDEVRLDHGRLCAADLLVKAGLDEGTPRYRAHAYDREGNPVEWEPLADTEGETVCFPEAPLSESENGYTIFALSVERPGIENAPPLWVHVAREEGGAPRVIGLWRE
ncbi:MAG: hypothetical protein AAF658_13745, partial [Myxococcota bacterium]